MFVYIRVHIQIMSFPVSNINRSCAVEPLVPTPFINTPDLFCHIFEEHIYIYIYIHTFVFIEREGRDYMYSLTLI